ncbi:MAG: dicarboxylate/amino acid:cation symporter [Clostridia bacterium]|nr:dicarboxylate/amino acid:cation symporter [Clostridia bacterium]
MNNTFQERKPERKSREEEKVKRLKKIGLFTWILIGFIAGIAMGIIAPEAGKQVKFLGTILTNLLNMVVVPLVMSLLITAAADVGDMKKLGKRAGRTFIIFMVTTAIAILIGLVMANLLAVGKGITINLEGLTADSSKKMNILDTLLGIIPTNIFSSMSSANLLQCIFFALLFGFALTLIPEDKGRSTVQKFFSGVAEVMKKITNIVLWFSPIGVFGLMAWVVGTYGLAILGPYAKAIAAVYLGCILHALFTQAGLMIGGICHRNPFRFVKEYLQTVLFAVATCSSVATIPLNLKTCKRLGAAEDVADFVIPFGAVINMDGTAIYEAVAAIFAAQVFGIDLSLSQQIMIMLSAVLASIGTAGVPGSGLIMLTVVLNAAGLPLEAVGLLAGVDRFLNMGRMIPNIFGDGATSMVVSKFEGKLGPMMSEEEYNRTHEAA